MGSVPAGIHWPRTLAARGAAPLHRAHLHHTWLQPPLAVLHCFVLDCSASMLADGQLARAKGVLRTLFDQAYRWRDQVALISFAGNSATLHLPPRRARAMPDAWLTPLGGGGGTPLTVALAKADALLHRHTHGPRWLWLLTDGRTRETPPRPAHAEHLRVIDFERARVPLGRCTQLAAHWGGQYLRADALWSESPFGCV